MLRTPPIVVEALAPRPVKIGNTVLQPLTLEGLLLLDATRLQQSDDPLTEAIRTAFILANTDAAATAYRAGKFDKALVKFATKTADIPDALLIAATDALIEQAFAPRAHTEFPETGADTEPLTSDSAGNGLGEILNILHSALKFTGHDYARALKTPVATLLALNVADRIRNGAKWEDPDYVTQSRWEQEDAASQASAPVETDVAAVHAPDSFNEEPNARQ